MLDRRLGALRAFDRADDARQGRLRGGARRVCDQQAFVVEAAAGNGAARMLGDRHRLASQHRFIDQAFAFDHGRVYRHPLAGPHQHHIAGHHLFDRQIDLARALGAGATHPRGRRAQGHQGAYRTCRAALRACFEMLAEQDQGDDDGGRFEIQMFGMPVREPQIQGQRIRRAGAERHQLVHGAGARLERLPGAAIKAPAEAELHRRGEQPLHPGRQHPMQAEGTCQHRCHQGQAEREAEQHRPQRQGRLGRVGAGHGGRVTGVGDGGDQPVEIAVVVHHHARGFGRQIDFGRHHAGLALEHLFDARDAGRAGHAIDMQIGFHGRTHASVLHVQKVGGPMWSAAQTSDRWRAKLPLSVGTP